MGALTELAAGTCPAAASPLAAARRLVVKIGSALLVDERSGRVRACFQQGAQGRGRQAGASQDQEGAVVFQGPHSIAAPEGAAM